MPFTKIHLAKGESAGFIRTFTDSIHETLVEVLQLPPDDRNQLVTEYNPEYFITKPPYRYFVEITLFSGRTPETKRKLYRRMVENLNGKLQIDPLHVFIILNEQPLENWGVRGGVAAADITLDFKVDV